MADKTITKLSERIAETYKLSMAEQRVLRDMLRGMSNREIASSSESGVYTSVKTVNNHTCAIYRKMKLKAKRGMLAIVVREMAAMAAAADAAPAREQS